MLIYKNYWPKKSCLLFLNGPLFLSSAYSQLKIWYQTCDILNYQNFSFFRAVTCMLLVAMMVLKSLAVWNNTTSRLMNGHQWPVFRNHSAVWPLLLSGEIFTSLVVKVSIKSVTNVTSEFFFFFYWHVFILLLYVRFFHLIKKRVVHWIPTQHPHMFYIHYWTWINFGKCPLD